MHIVPEHMKDDFLSRARAEYLALRFRQHVRLREHISEIGYGPASEGTLDHVPRGIEPGDQLGGRMQGLSLLFLLPVHKGGYFGSPLAHPSLEPPDPVVEDVLDEHPDRPVSRRYWQCQLLGR